MWAGGPPTGRSQIADKVTAGSGKHLNKGIRPCIPGRKPGGKAVGHDGSRYEHRNLIEIMFGSLKKGRRIATRNDRCAITFVFAVAPAKSVIFRL